MQLAVALDDLLDNPYRRLDHDPPRDSKLDKLEESIMTTGYWNGRINARAAPAKRGKYEICFNHHVLRALRRIYPGSHKILVEVGNFSDMQMLQVLARENQEEWSTDALTILSIVRATIEAYDQGVIELGAPDNKPYFSPRRNKPYGREALAKFLGWLNKDGRPSNKCEWAVFALDLIKTGDLAEKDLARLSDRQAHDLVREIRRRKKDRESQAKIAEETAARHEKAAKQTEDAQERKAAEEEQRSWQTKAKDLRDHSKNESRIVASTVGKELREGRIGTRQIRETANIILPPDPAQSKPPPKLREGARAMARELDGLYAPKDLRRKKLDEIIRYRGQLDQITRELLTDALANTAERFAELAKAFGQEPNNGPGQPTHAGPRKLKR
jgi:hypothetical protein